MDEGENEVANQAMAQPKPDFFNELNSGSLFESRYEIVENLGTGASGTTYKANDSILQRVVALKIIHHYLLQSPEAVDRFKKEGALSTSLSHSNIIRVYNQGVAEDGRLYIVMDCLEGETLSQLIKQHGSLQLDLFFNLMLQIQDALIYAHGHGIVHRDVKPDNIVVISDGDSKKAVLLDFGIAQCVDLNNNQDATKTASMLGSSAYMSPEQCKGQQVDSRADIYSLGCVMFECLSGKAPFLADTALEVMYKHSNEPAEKLPFFKQLPKSISAMILKCLQKQPEQRYQHVDELRAECVNCLDKYDKLDGPWSPSRLAKRNKVIVGLASSVLLACIYFGVQSTEKRGADNVPITGKSHSASLHHLPINEEELVRSATAVRIEKGDEAAIKYLLEWDSKNGSNPTLIDTRLAVWESLSYIYSSMDKEAEALKYLDLGLKENKPIPPLKAITDLVEMYIRRGEPTHGLALLSKLSPRLKSDVLPAGGYAGIKQVEGCCYLDLRDYKQAIAPLKQSMRPELLEDASQIAGVNQRRGYLIWAYTALGQKENANREIELLVRETQALAKSREVLMGSAYLEIADSLNRGNNIRLSSVYLEKSIDAYLAAGKVDQAIIDSVQLSSQYSQLNQFDAAEKCLLRAMKFSAKVEDKEHVFASLINLKKIHHGSAAALECSRELIKLEEDALKTESGDLCTQESKHYATAAAKFWDLLLETKRYGEAYAFMDSWLVRLREKASKSSTLAYCLKLEAQAYVARSNFEKALDVVNQEISLLEDKSVINKCLSHKYDVSADLSDAYLSKSSILNSKNLPKEALAAMSQCEEYLKKFPNDYVRAMDINYQFTQIYVVLGKSDEVDRHMALVYKLLRTRLPAQTDLYAKFLWQYADYCYCTSKYASATKYFTEAVEIIKKIHGPSCETLRLYYC
ncbi:MAG: serine/threonine protein kinase, partial [Candidatus Obscuribacterales bacterium]|nr:serine/threonine protein kinase [Candidatus Obscuribacterales bacterium]